MDERIKQGDKMEEIMLPGFRFHPTDEELVGFYLKRKIQQKPLSIELIKQLDIYKYDPWDLPKLATTGEKEWYFYCPRDRKYRNSARPNRVTEAGFWKATGTDRPIYSSEGTKCIGLKKSLVFYRGRAAKGVKTDWMMHEFRLPSITEYGTTKRFIDKTIPANDSLAICRIFKKTNTTAQRALSHSWVSSVLPETTHAKDSHFSSHHFNLENIPLTTRTSTPAINFHGYNDNQTHPSDFSCYKPINPISTKIPNHQLPISNGDFSSSGFLFSSPYEPTEPMFNLSSSSILGGFCNTSSDSIEFSCSQEQCNGNGFFQGSVGKEEHEMTIKNQNEVHSDEQWEIFKSIGFPFGMPLNMGGDAWKSSSFLWDSSSCPSEMSTTKCFT